MFILLWIAFIVIEIILFSMTYYLISSEFFVKKTGIRIFLKKGNVKDNDYLTVFLFLLAPVLLVGSGIFIRFLGGENHLSNASVMFGIYYTYFLCGILYRIRYFRYIDEKEDHSYSFTYPYISSFLNMVYNLINVMLMIFYCIFAIPYSGYCWIFWFMYIHIVIIFPDYVNKYLPKDIREEGGFDYYFRITSLPASIIVLIILFFVNQSPLL